MTRTMNDRPTMTTVPRDRLEALPARFGPMPALDAHGPLWQRDQRAAPALWVAVWDALRGIPGVIIGPSAMAEPDARAVLVPQVTNPVDGTSFAPRGTPLEPAHLHGPRDTSLHLVLPPARAAQVVENGWGVPCPYARFGTELILFAARDDEELAVIAALAREGVLWALHANAVTTLRPSVLSTRFAI